MCSARCDEKVFQKQWFVKPLILAVLATVLVVDCATRAPQDTDEFSVQSCGASSVRYSVKSCLPSKVGVSSLPIQLEELAFLFEKSGKCYVNLTYSHDIDSLFRQNFPNSPAYGFGTQLSVEQQAWVLQHCREKVGDSFSSVNLMDGKTAMARIQGLSGYAEGGNGDIGFVGDLNLPSSPSASLSDDIFGERIIGFAFPASEPCSFRFRPTAVFSRKDLERVQQLLRSELEDPKCHVLKAVRNPNDGAILVLAEHKRRSCEPDRGASVFYLMRVNSTLRVIPFSDTPYSIILTPDMGFPVDIYPGCRENTRFFFLPDIDRDGRDELFVSCREGFVFKVVKQKDDQIVGDKFSLVSVRNFHYGMRE